MGLRARILQIVHPESGGPRPRRLLEGIARAGGKTSKFIDDLIKEGALVQYGKKKGTKWGLPR